MKRDGRRDGMNDAYTNWQRCDSMMHEERTWSPLTRHSSLFTFHPPVTFQPPLTSNENCHLVVVLGTAN